MKLMYSVRSVGAGAAGYIGQRQPMVKSNASCTSAVCAHFFRRFTRFCPFAVGALAALHLLDAPGFCADK